MADLCIFKAFSILRDTILDAEFVSAARKSLSAFTRVRKLLFPDLINLILSMKSRCLQAEIDDYFTKKDVEPVSRQGFYQ